MRYGDLSEILLTLDDAKLDHTVTVCIAGEYYGLSDLITHPHDDTLDEGHLVLVSEDDNPGGAES
jgi:hypothetical protein